MSKHTETQKIVMAFDANYKLCAMFRSVKEAARICNIGPLSIAMAVRGQTLTSMGKYWREIPDDTIIDSDDFNEYTVFDADHDIGTDRLVYSDSTQQRNQTMLSSKRGKKYRMTHNK